jgi:hypothetical protein
VIAHTFREVCASSQSGPDETTVSRLEELRGRRHHAEQAARSLLNLNPEEQSRVLVLLVETVTVSKQSVDIHFRANGIEQIVDELTPMSERTDG